MARPNSRTPVWWLFTDQIPLKGVSLVGFVYSHIDDVSIWIPTDGTHGCVVRTWACPFKPLKHIFLCIPDLTDENTK